MNNILQANVENRGIVFDPRTKLLMLITMTTFVLGGIGGEKLTFLTPCFCILILLLLLCSKKSKTAIVFLIVYGAAESAFLLSGSSLKGILYFLLLGTSGIITRFMPSIMLAMYVVSTTTVSEFTAAMQKMHISEKLIIPLSVMFRFFPTVADEFSSINDAMKMRGILMGGNKASQMIEYRFIPLMSCCVKIGEELSAAALTRGLGGECKRTNVCRIGFHLQDLIAIVFCILPFVLLILEKTGIV